ncbi:MAG: arginine--tRNA ligase, partial [Ruminiclostridium sp.]|nr:arginine--tRNA ligase [Ruminiclostridium sp.]
MANLIQYAKDQVTEVTRKAYEAAAAAGVLPGGAELKGGVEIPKDPTNGDYASSYAMATAKALKMNPRAIAEAITNHMDLEGTIFSSVEIAGPGFMNFRLGSKWYGDVLAEIEAEGPVYGKGEGSKGQKVMVEFVSANPTGPMHMGNARGGVLGDTLANVLARDGADTWKEFYVNDAGNQINKFAVSIQARYFQILLGEENVEFPEDGYHGQDIKDLAQAFYEKHGDSFKDVEEQTRLDALAAFGLEHNIPKMKADLKRYGIEYDEWFFESSLHNSGYVAETVGMLTQRGWTYEKDGALWLKTADLLKQKFLAEGKSQKQVDKLELKDDVLCRANGFYTYFAADIAYHRNKLEVRGFDKVINIWGADHHGHVARLKCALDALGVGGDKLDIVLMQLVRLTSGGELVRMSKRSGKAITLSNLLDDIPIDVARFFFNMREPGSQLDFDLDLAVEQSNQNPVYYVQYAHARICSIIKNLAAEGVAEKELTAEQLNVLTHPDERELIRELAS